MNADGTNDKILVNEGVWQFEKRDNLLFYVTKNNYYKFSINVLNVDNNSNQLITNDEDPWQFIIANDRIYYNTYKNGILKSCKMDGSDIKVLSNATIVGNIAYDEVNKGI